MPRNTKKQMRSYNRQRRLEQKKQLSIEGRRESFALDLAARSFVKGGSIPHRAMVWFEDPDDGCEAVAMQ